MPHSGICLYNSIRMTFFDTCKTNCTVVLMTPCCGQVDPCLSRVSPHGFHRSDCVILRRLRWVSKSCMCVSVQEMFIPRDRLAANSDSCSCSSIIRSKIRTWNFERRLSADSTELYGMLPWRTRSWGQAGNRIICQYFTSWQAIWTYHNLVTLKEIQPRTN